MVSKGTTNMEVDLEIFTEILGYKKLQNTYYERHLNGQHGWFDLGHKSSYPVFPTNSLDVCREVISMCIEKTKARSFELEFSAQFGWHAAYYYDSDEGAHGESQDPARAVCIASVVAIRGYGKAE